MSGPVQRPHISLHVPVQEWVGFPVTACDFCGQRWPCEYELARREAGSRPSLFNCLSCGHEIVNTHPADAPCPFCKSMAIGEKGE